MGKVLPLLQKFITCSSTGGLAYILLINISALLHPSSLAHSDTQRSTQPAEEIIITATLTPLTSKESLRPVSVLTQEDIKALHAASMIDLLQGLPGLQFSRTGGIGANSSLFLRGSNSNHVLVLVDGVRISNANSGGTPWNELLPEQIERIEVVRGPRAALYGSDAVGGVVQIFTHRKKEQVGNTQSLNLSYGNRDTIRTSAYFAHQSENFSASLGLSGYDTQGISHRDSGGLNDDDSARAQTVKISLQHNLPHPQSTISLNYLHSISMHEFDAFSPPPADPPANIFEENLLESFQAVYNQYIQSDRADHDWRTKIELGYSKNDNESIDPTAVFGPTHSRFNSIRRSLRWINTIETNDTNTWVAGIDYYQDSVERNEDTPNDSRDNVAAFLEYQYLGTPSQVIAFLRTDDNEQYGGHSTIGVDWGFDILSWLKWTVSYGESFHAPTFNDLYGFGGSTELEPEEAVNTEIGLYGQHARHQWAIHVFNNEIDELISVVAAPTPGNPFRFAAVNIDKARIRGVEVEWNFVLDRLRIDTSISWLDPRDLSNDSILLRRARREYKANLRYQHDRWELGAGLIARSKRYDFCGSAVDNCLGGYALLNLSAAWEVHPQWRIQLKLDNVGAKRYRLASGYNIEERSILFSINWQSD